MIDEKLQGILDELPFDLNEKQLKAVLAYIDGDGHFFLTSEAGGGKTVIIDVLKKYYGDEMVTCASTGVGNQNLHNGFGGDGTAHRVWSIPYNLGDKLEKVKSPCSNIFAGSDLVKHVVVDEAPMLNSEALYVILKRIQRFNKKTSKRQKRNIRVMLVGDSLQLPSVIKEDTGAKEYLINNYGSHKFYRSFIWKEFNPTILMLDEVMRQGDKIFRACLDVLRYGEKHRYEGVLKWLNQRVDYNYDKSMFTVAAYKATVDNVNARVLNSNPNDKMVYKAKVRGNFNLIENDVEKEITLCQGLECITTVNDEYGEFFNGSLCTVEQCCIDGCWAILKSTGKRIWVPLHEYKQEETYVEKGVVSETGEVRDILKRRETGTCTQISLLQASSITTHRSQGKTFNTQGIVDMGVKGFYQREGDYGCSLLYVALSRFTDVNLITLPRKLHEGHIKVDEDAIAFWFECKEKSVI